MVSPLFFCKGSENNKMAGLWFTNPINKNIRLAFDEEQEYGWSKIVYIRFRNKSYDKVKPYVLRTLGLKDKKELRNKNSLYAARAEKAIKNFYRDRLNIAKIFGTANITQDDYKKIVDTLVTAINTAQTRIPDRNDIEMMSSYIGNTLNEFDKLGVNNTIQAIEYDLNVLEQQLNQNLLLRNYVSALNQTGNNTMIINSQNQLEFEKYRQSLQQLKKQKDVKISNLTSGLSSSFTGPLGELIAGFAQDQLKSCVGENLKINKKNVQLIGTATPTLNLYGQKVKRGSGKPDTGMELEIEYKGQIMRINIGTSVKLVGDISTLDKRKKKKITFLSTAQKYGLAEALVQSYGNDFYSIPMQNAIFNTLAFAKGTTREYKMIKKAITSQFFVKAITGGRGLLKQGNQIIGYDVADILIINNQAYPLYKLLEKIVEKFNSTIGSTTLPMNVTINTEKVKNAWEPPIQDNRGAAFYRSQTLRQQFLKKSELIFTLNMNQIDNYLR